MTIREKLIRICDSFAGKNFEIPRGGSKEDIEKKMTELTRRIVDSS